MEKGITAFYLKKSFLFCLPVLFFLFLLSCNNNSTDKKKDALVDTSGKKTISAPATTSFNGNFPILSIPKTDLDDYFDPPPHKNLHKIVFRFRFEDGNSLPNLVMYGATSMSVFQPPSTPLGVVNATSLSIAISDSFYLGNLELTRKFYRDTLKTSAGTHPDLIFYPVLSSRYPYQVTYRLGWGNTSPDSIQNYHLLPPPPAAATSDELNPSPPAPPGS